MKKPPKGIRKYIRREKARIRREGGGDIKSLLSKYYKKVKK